MKEAAGSGATDVVADQDSFSTAAVSQYFVINSVVRSSTDRSVLLSVL